MLMGHPLIAYSIIAARESRSISRTIVSTDSEEIAEIAKQYGADVPFLRPAEFSTDSCTDRGFIVHAIKWLAEHEKLTPEYIVHLRPTTPLREPTLIDEAIKLLKENPNASSLRSAHLAIKTPYKWFEMDGFGYFKGIRHDDLRPEYYNLPRQCFPPVYDPNGYVDILRTSQVLNTESIHGGAILGFITPFCHELDSSEDLLFMHYLAERKGSSLINLLDSLLPRNQKTK